MGKVSHITYILGTIAASSVILLPGCIESSNGGSNESESTDPNGLPNPDKIEKVEINVSDTDQTSYFDLNTSSIEQNEPEHWHLSFTSRQIRTNSGNDSAYVTGFLGAEAPADFYNSDGEPNAREVTKANPDDYRANMIATFDEIDASIRPAISGEVPLDEPGDFFYQLDMEEMPPKLIENDSVGWLIRGRDGETYARLRATEIYFDMGGNESFTYTFTMDRQPSTAGGFESHSHAAGVEFSGELERYRRNQHCFDFVDYDPQDNNPGIAKCSSDNWDLKIFRDPTARMGEDLTLLINGGFDRNGSPCPGYAAALGPLPWSELSSEISAEDVSGYPQDLIQDQVESIAADDWYVEIPKGDLPEGETRTIWPTYRVYVIDTDARDENASRYAFQITDIGYDNANDNIKTLTARYVKIP